MSELRRLLLVVLVAAASACGGGDGEGVAVGGSGGALPERAAEVEGTLTSVTPGAPASVLVEAEPGVQGGRKIVLAVDADVPVARQVGEAVEAVGTDDLAQGQRVQAWVDGPVAESYPEQGRAEALLILG